jgi:transposase-like protein
MEQMRWGGSPFCPHCSSTKPYKLKGGKAYRCGNRQCRKDFSVTVGTIFENSKVKLSTWLAAIYLLTGHKKGISSHQLARDLGVTQKTAWFINNRVRLIMGDPNPEPLDNIVEVNSRIIISYSDARAKKDAANRKRGLEKLEKNLAKGKLTKQHINNRGYNKYLKLEGDVTISIDKQKYKADAKWDGLKGYSTNTKLTKDQIIENYSHLWQIEKAFRISKTDLRIRPIYHRIKRRIEAHICIAFCAYKVYKELDRQLKVKNATISPEKAIDTAKTIYRITIQTNLSNTLHSRLYIDKDEQKYLLKLFDL